MFKKLNYFQPKAKMGASVGISQVDNAENELYGPGQKISDRRLANLQIYTKLHQFNSATRPAS